MDRNPHEVGGPHGGETECCTGSGSGEVSGVPDLDVSGEVECPEQEGLVAHGVWKKMAHVISTMFNPLVMPFYSIILLLYGHTIMYYLPVRTKMFFILAILLNTAVVPMLFIVVLKATGYVKTINIVDRKDRVLPLIVTAFCYAICAYMIRDLMIAFVVKRILVSGAVCVLFAAVVTYFWKISLHMIAMGGGLAILVIITVSKIGLLQPWIIAAVIGSGLVAASRLYLGRHTPVQIAAGFFSGLVIASGIMLM